MQPNTSRNLREDLCMYHASNGVMSFKTFVRSIFCKNTAVLASFVQNSLRSSFSCSTSDYLQNGLIYSHLLHFVMELWVDVQFVLLDKKS